MRVLQHRREETPDLPRPVRGSVWLQSPAARSRRAEMVSAGRFIPTAAILTVARCSRETSDSVEQGEQRLGTDVAFVPG